MKKEFICSLILFFFIGNLFSLNYVYAQDDLDGFQNDSVVQGVQKLQEFTEEKKWEYLGERWKEFLLQNKFISSLDGFFKKINFLFFLFLGQDYELSLTLFFVFLIWLFFWVMFYKIIRDFSSFSDPVSFIIGTALSIILAHLKFCFFLSNLLFKVIFFREGMWRWISFFVFIILYFVFLIFLERIVWKIGRALKKSKEEKEKWDEKFERQVFRKKVEGVEEAFKEIGEGLK